MLLKRFLWSGIERLWGQVLPFPAIRCMMKKRQIFLDCDGVLADFDKRAEAIVGMKPREFDKHANSKEFWDMIYADPNFFSELDPMEDADELVRGVLLECEEHNLKMPIILTGKPRHRHSHGDWSIEQKLAWRDKYHPTLEMIVTESHNKKLHMKPGDIIIDDWDKYRQIWINAGGLWILHKTAQQSLVELHEILER